MKQRFEARDSRDDDVEKIAELSAEVNALDNLNVHLRRETQAIARELDNRDQNDYIFGNAQGHRAAPGPRKSLGSRSQSVSTWSNHRRVIVPHGERNERGDAKDSARSMTKCIV